MNISSIDLNLLVAFDVLMAERNVSRAAKRVGLSQSGMSNALGRLRVLLDDRVLERTADGMVPTRKALELAPRIHEALEQLGRALGGAPTFEPATSEHRFRIASADYLEYVLLPALLERLKRQAPRIDLDVSAIGRGLDTDDLATGRTDLAIAPGGVSEPLREQLLFEERLVCLVRKGHPVIKKRLTLEQYVAASHVLVAPRGKPGSWVDRVLAEKGLSRRIAMVTPHFLVAPRAVAGSDLVSTLPEQLARSFARDLPLVIHEPPLHIPTFSVHLIWHVRSDGDPALRWLREQLIDIAASS